MFHRTTLVFAMVILGAFVSLARAKDLVLAENGHSAYQIVLAESVSPSTRHGARNCRCSWNR